MTKLFLSHASEDKAPFVEPLAHDLSKDFEVWYDKFSLVIGMSLRQEIDRGLREADFGVVVLSPNFFKKQWTNNELDGLFALETATRKLILPLWYGVTFEEVKSYSSMLAARLGFSGTDPAAAANEVRRAVANYYRTVEITRTNRSRDALLALANASKRAIDEHAFFTRDAGAAAVAHSVHEILTKLRADIDDVNKQQQTFRVSSSAPHHLTIDAPHYVTLIATTRGMSSNYVKGGELKALYFHRNDWGELPRDRGHFEEQSFSPTLIDGRIFWKEEDNTEPLEPRDVAASIAGALSKHVSDAIVNPPLDPPSDDYDENDA